MRLPGLRRQITYKSSLKWLLRLTTVTSSEPSRGRASIAPEVIQQNRGGKKPLYLREIELDITFRKPGKPRNGGLSKEVIEKRRREKLCFEYGLPGYIASSYRQKKEWSKRKQVSTIGRSSYQGPTRQFNATY